MVRVAQVQRAIMARRNVGSAVGQSDLSERACSFAFAPDVSPACRQSHVSMYTRNGVAMHFAAQVADAVLHTVRRGPTLHARVRPSRFTASVCAWT